MSGYEGHTPGPWHVADSGAVWSVGAGKWVVTDADDADAALIAAAPDLLTRVEALETGLRRALALWDGKDEPGDFDRDVFDPLRHLLNNGNGEGTQGVRAE